MNRFKGEGQIYKYGTYISPSGIDLKMKDKSINMVHISHQVGCTK
jgi:hypothetical protein